MNEHSARAQHTALEAQFVRRKHGQKRLWMHLACSFSEDNQPKTLSLGGDAVLIAGLQNNLDASEKCNTEFS